jgi:hypothetical protein
VAMNVIGYLGALDFAAGEVARVLRRALARKVTVAESVLDPVRDGFRVRLIVSGPGRVFHSLFVPWEYVEHDRAGAFVYVFLEAIAEAERFWGGVGAERMAAAYRPVGLP